MAKTFDEIKKEYDAIRLNDIISYEDNKAKIYNQYKDLKLLDDSIVKAYVAYAKAEATSVDVAKAKKELDEVKLRRDKYVKENNISDDYLEVKYHCNICKDTGYVEGKKCRCLLKKEIDLFNSISNFENLARACNFDNLDMSYYNQDIVISNNGGKYFDYMKRIIAHMKDSIKNMDVKPYNAIFVGATGTGKTFLARAIGAEAVKYGKTVLYTNVNDYLNSLKPDYKGEPLESYAISSDLFILDDLGTEASTDFTTTKINYIIDKRINDSKSTVITTNLVGEELRKRYLDSMLSRILNIYQSYLLKGNDLRGLKYGNV